MFKFSLGLKVKDAVTGFTGTITGRAEYLTGCKQYSITPKAKKGEEGNYPKGVWLDEERVIPCGRTMELNVHPSGGPQNHPSKF